MTATDRAEVVIKPPVLFLGALALGALLSLVIPLGPRLASPNGQALAVGVIFVAIGFALAAFSVRNFRRAGTTDGPQLRDALASTDQFHGVTGTITLDDQRNATKSAVILQVKGGKFVFLETIAP